MALTEQQLEEAAQEIARREQASRDGYARECAERRRVDEEQFETKMDAWYPDVDRETRYSIYTDYREFHE